MLTKRSWHACVLTVMVAVLAAGCGTAEPVTETSAQASPSPSAAAPTLSASPSEAASPSGSAEASVLEVDWTLPFAVTAPATWTTDVPPAIGVTTSSGTWLGASDRYLAFTTTGPETVDAWVESVTSAEQLVASEPVEVDIGGAAGYRVDLEVSDAASEERCFNPGRCYSLFQDDSGYWPIVEGRPTRAWFVDVDGETLAIVTDAPERAFDEWAASAEEVLATLEWGTR